LIPKDSEELHLPTDLIGITPGYFIPLKKDEDLLAALGPFCNKVRRQIKRNWPQMKKKEHVVEVNSVRKPVNCVEQLEETSDRVGQVKEIECGITADEFGNFSISAAPTVFWDHRVCQAFPGIRGVQWFNNKAEAVYRLQILLKEPIFFEDCQGHGVTGDPIWWWRGKSHLHISEFRGLSETRCLMNTEELEIERIAVYRSRAYYASFVYVEVNPDKPTGLYPHLDEATIQDIINEFGYANEEYAIFQGNMITRECYDDGAVVIDGVVMDTSGAELRLRHLSKNNFLIAPKFSPINSKKFDSVLDKLLKDMLNEKIDIEDICNIVDELP
jgi:hypothetical protein